MSKLVEEAALKAYPIEMREHPYYPSLYDINESDRLTFIEGYEQALNDIKSLIDSNCMPGYAAKIIRLIEQHYE